MKSNSSEVIDWFHSLHVLGRSLLDRLIGKQFNNFFISSYELNGTTIQKELVHEIQDFLLKTKQTLLKVNHENIHDKIILEFFDEIIFLIMQYYPTITMTSHAIWFEFHNSLLELFHITFKLTTKNDIKTFQSKFLICYISFVEFNLQEEINFLSKAFHLSNIKEDWSCNSPYMREKRISHGILAFTNSIRSIIFHLFKTPISNPNQSWSSESFGNSANEIYGHFYEHSLSFGYKILNHFLEKVLLVYLYHIHNLSRVRLSQWQMDLSYVLLISLHTIYYIDQTLKKHNNSDSLQNYCDQLSPSTKELIKSTFLSILAIHQILYITRLMHYEHLVTYIETHYSFSTLKDLVKTPCKLSIVTNIIFKTSDNYFKRKVFTPSSIHVSQTQENSHQMNSPLVFDFSNDFYMLIGLQTDLNMNWLSFWDEQEFQCYQNEIQSSSGNQSLAFRSIILKRLKVIESDMHLTFSSYQEFKMIISSALARVFVVIDDSILFMKELLALIFYRRYEFIQGEYPILTSEDIINVKHLTSFLDL